MVYITVMYAAFVDVEVAIVRGVFSTFILQTGCPRFTVLCQVCIRDNRTFPSDRFCTAKPHSV